MRAAARIGAAAALAAVCGASYALEPQVNYQLNCMGCHHADGAGERGRVPSLRRTLVPFSGRPQTREFILRVPGVAQSALSDLDLAALLNWMALNLSDVPVPANFVEFTPAEVGSARRRPLAAVASLRARLRRQIKE